MYHNTTNESGNSLICYYAKAKTQEDRILAIMSSIGKPMTPFDVHAEYIKYYKHCPVTSIRRAMTDLTEEGKLIKKLSYKKGNFGRPNHVWVCSQNNKEEVDLLSLME